ncbi:MAG: zinc-binding alcohol dehydrogenase [Lentisphaerae bacterium]|nr:zinc-binding alcohol dehydrogenase [Lentisphaerota bacterium]
MKTQAIVAVAPRTVEIREIDIGDVGDWDIRVELEVSAISVGTESYVIGREEVSANPFVPGYAPIGRIVETGDSVTGFAVGDRVSYFSPRTPPDAALGSGGHQSSAIIDVDPAHRNLLGPDSFCVKVPEGLSSDRAAFGGISSVSCRGIGMAAPSVGERVFVVGQGLIGQFTAAHAHLRGAEVTVADLYDRRLDAARVNGADHVINAGREDLAEALRKTWPGGADILVDTTGNYRVIEASLAALRWRGNTVFLGWCKGTDFDFARLQAKGGTAFFPWTLEGHRVLNSWRLMDSGALHVDHLITHRFPYRDAQKAYDLVYNAPGEYLGIVLDWRKE